ncbi:universal stress protein [Asanoa sp. NPDC049518]|uniref:universal stress protein n=1 Tax=unclassified Asanoa TaxID=2685164 RepID=UPI0034192B5F
MWAREVVVGADGSAASLAAVGWAARAAERHRVPLRVVLAYHWDRASARSAGEMQLRSARDGVAEADAARAVTHAQAAAPGVEIRRETVIGPAVPNLLTAARDARLLVVGHPGHGRVGSVLTGSVAQAVASHAPCPVVVVRGRADAVTGPIVVGVDGSTSSLETLGLAFDEAAGQAAALVPVLAVAPMSGPWGDIAEQSCLSSGARLAEEAALAEWLAPWREKHPEVVVRPLVLRGNAAPTLVDQSRTARLVAVGSRGHGGLAATLIGSVGQHLLHHAGCPVMINRRWPVNYR